MSCLPSIVVQNACCAYGQRLIYWVCRAYEDDPLLFFFFFQAEDGIRDLTVTGVQTCALPISPRVAFPSPVPRGRRESRRACVCPPRRPLRSRNQRCTRRLCSATTACCVHCARGRSAR